MYQKAAAAGTSEEFLEQRLFYGFRHRIFCISMLKELLQLKMSTCFSIHYRILNYFFLTERRQSPLPTEGGHQVIKIPALIPINLRDPFNTTHKCISYSL